MAPTTLVWGDSYACAWLPDLIDAPRRQDSAFVLASIGQCPPALGFDPGNRPGYRRGNEAIYAWLKRQSSVGTVVLTGRWKSYEDDTVLVAQLAATTRILKRDGLRVVIVDSVPSYKRPVPIVLAAWLRLQASSRWCGSQTPAG